MIGFKVFRQTSTSFDLNGPILSFIQQPTAKSVCNAGIATFVGIATATFPTQTPANPAVGLGSIAYRWYEVGVGALSDKTNVTGTATTTLTLSNLSNPDDNERQFYLEADYISSGKTPNAINDGLQSQQVSLTVNPSIIITTQPSNVTTVLNNSGTFNIVARTTYSTTDSLRYLWKLNGSDISDGIITDTVVEEVTTTSSAASGFTTPGIYFDLTSLSGNVSVTFSTSEESGIFHYINIPGIKNFPENNGSETFTLVGGNIYGPCTAPNGGLYIGAETPVGGSATLVVEEGGDDWNDMILSANQGYFRRLSSSPQTVSSQTTTSQTVTRKTTVSGTTTPTLTISSDKVGIQTVSCTVFHDSACNSPLSSSNAQLNAISSDSISRSILKYEIVRDDNAILYSLGEQNIFTSPLNFASDLTNPSRSIVVYAPEKDINVKITLSAAAGQSFGDNLGGAGGFSIFEYTLRKNVEYVFKLNPSIEPFGGIGGGGGAAFFYEKAKLLAVCGGGGGASSGGKGGDGGGAGIVGQSGSGRNGGTGGSLINPGLLNTSGLASNGIIGGRVESCTIGTYYRIQGFAPCSDIGNEIPWRNSSGIAPAGENGIVTAQIIRGYKTGTSYRNNGGKSSFQENGIFVGGGGSGAVGGNATQSPGSSGGGGSGYTNGSVSIISTQLGGNLTTNSFVIIEIQP
jgi:hypothetical protein